MRLDVDAASNRQGSLSVPTAHFHSFSDRVVTTSSMSPLTWTTILFNPLVAAVLRRLFWHCCQGAPVLQARGLLAAPWASRDVGAMHSATMSRMSAFRSHSCRTKRKP
jgi:hypothetical protein